MKIEFFKIKKSFKKGGFHTNPNISWGIVLCLALVLIGSFFIFGYYLFTLTDKEFVVLDSDIENGQTRIVTKERIDKSLEYFSERVKKSIQILNSPAPIVDPSL